MTKWVSFQTVRAALAKSAPGAGKSFRRAGPGRAADCQPRRRLDRNHRHSRSHRVGCAGHLHPFRRVPLRDSGNGEGRISHWRRCASSSMGELSYTKPVSTSWRPALSPSGWRKRLPRYHSNAITAAEVVQELIGLAKDIRAVHQRGEEDGLTQEEIAFYDALAQNESAVEGDGQRPSSRHRPGVAERPEKQGLRGLATPQVGARRNAGSGQTHPPQAPLPAGSARRRRTNRPATG